MNIIKESFDNNLTPYYAMVIAIWGQSLIVDYIVVLFLARQYAVSIALVYRSDCVINLVNPLTPTVAQLPYRYSCKASRARPG